MLNKKLKRQRRATKTRAKIKAIAVARLCVDRTVKHLYAQIITGDEKGDRVLTCASTLDEEVRSLIFVKETKKKSNNALTGFNNIRAASIVGDIIAKRATALGINRVAFDRSGFKYHGRVKALAEAARESGLLF